MNLSATIIRWSRVQTPATCFLHELLFQDQMKKENGYIINCILGALVNELQKVFMFAKDQNRGQKEAGFGFYNPHSHPSGCYGVQIDPPSHQEVSIIQSFNCTRKQLSLFSR